MTKVNVAVLSWSSFVSGVSFRRKNDRSAERIFRFPKRKNVEDSQVIEQQMPNGEWERVFYVQEINDSCAYIECTVSGIAVEGQIMFKHYVQHI